VRAIKLMADYDCWPLWEASPGVVGNIDPETLPISRGLKDRLARWAAEFDASLNRDDPANSPVYPPEELAAFSAEGRRLGEDLQAELGPDFHVIVRVG
jgi:hypothetical protein